MEIPVTEIGPVRIGQTENAKAATGCTVLIAEQGMAAGLDVRYENDTITEIGAHLDGGEVIDAGVIERLKYYGVAECDVVR